MTTYREYNYFLPQINNIKVNPYMIAIGAVNKNYTGFTNTIGYSNIARAQGEVAVAAPSGSTMSAPAPTDCPVPNR